MGLLVTSINRSEGILSGDLVFEYSGNFMFHYVYGNDAPDIITSQYQYNHNYFPFAHSHSGASQGNDSIYCEIRVKTDSSGIKDLSLSVPGTKKGNGKLWACGNTNPNGKYLKFTDHEGYYVEFEGLTECRFSNGVWSVDLPNCNFAPNTIQRITLVGETPNSGDEVIVGALDKSTTITLTSAGAYSLPAGSVDVPPVDNTDYSDHARGYRVVVDDLYDIFDKYDKELILLDATLELEINTAGSFEFIMPPNHRYYDYIQPYNCIIEVYEDKVLHWFGRPISIEIDYYRQKKVYCEGALNFLKDKMINTGNTTAGAWIEAYAESADLYETDDDRELDVRITSSAKNALKSLLARGDLDNQWYPIANEGVDFKIRKNSEYLDTPIKIYNDSIQEITLRSHVTDIGNSEWYGLDLSPNAELYANHMKIIRQGYVTINDMITGDRSRFADNSSSTVLDVFNNILLDYFGGYVFLSREPSRSNDDGGWTGYAATNENWPYDKRIYFNWYKDMPYECNQIIEFGLNLLDFQSQFNGENFATIIIGKNENLGERKKDNEVIYVSDAALIYGNIEKEVEFSSAKDLTEVKKLAKEYCEDLQFNASIIECTAADLHPINDSYEPFRIGQTVHCRSVPHLVDKWFPLTKMTIELNKDEGAKQITLGTKPRETLTRVVNEKKYWVGTQSQYNDMAKDSSSDGIYFVTED